MNILRAVGRSSINGVHRLGRRGVFLYTTLGAVARALRRWSLVVRQLYMAGVMTLLITVVAGVFVGMVLSLQGYYTLVNFGGESALGLMVALSLTRELGPVLGALLFTGRAGSAMTAEIGLMKATEQLAAMEMMAVDPITRVIAPRFIAGMLAVPLLTMIFNVVGILGGYYVGVVQLGVDGGVYWSSMQDGVDVYQDIGNGFVKSIVFGFVVSWIALFEGYDADPTAAGISRATTGTVVSGSLAVLGLDYILTALMFGEVGL